jgi:hypothetical protein
LLLVREVLQELKAQTLQLQVKQLLLVVGMVALLVDQVDQVAQQAVLEPQAKDMQVVLVAHPQMMVIPNHTPVVVVLAV